MLIGILSAILLVIFIYFVMLYNGLVNCKNNVAKAWANINVLLKQRHDELPKLVDTCKQYMQFEQETLEKVIKARAQVLNASESQNFRALGKAEGELRNGLGSLFALVESYPELKANEQFQYLQARISELESGIADRREFYNESVNIYNVNIEEFPSVFVAQLFHFMHKDMLRFASAELKDVDIGSRFG